MTNNIFSFNTLVAKISDCRKRMTCLRHDILLHEESGKPAVHEKRELYNLSNQLNNLLVQLQNFRRNTGAVKA